MDEGLKIGELARRAGVSVRTLHYWDDIGLLRPCHRTPAGHRRYRADAVAQVARIRDLQGLGLRLREIQNDASAPGWCAVVREHARRGRDVVRAELRRVRDLEQVAEHLRRHPDLGLDDFARLVEYVQLGRRYFTQVQRDRLEQRSRELGAQRLAANRAERAELLEDLRREHQAGTDAAAPRTQELLRRSRVLGQELTGGDPAIDAAVARMARAEPSFRCKRGVDDSLFAFLQNAERHARLIPHAT